jgi:hypothetical protein
MIDWLSSKFALLVAAVFILASAFSIIRIQRRSIEDLELERIAEDIASIVNSAALINGQTSIGVEFGKGSQGESFPAEVGGAPYTIKFTHTAVLIVQSSKGFLAVFIGSVHLWKPGQYSAEGARSIEEIDQSHRHLQLESGTDFVVERKLIEMEGGDEYRTFVYKR